MHKFIRLIVVGVVFILAATGFQGLHAQSFSITDSTETSVELTFSTSSGVLVLVSSDASFSNPVDGTSYNAGDFIGSDEVVYVGGTSPHTHASLTSGTHYYYRAWEYDGSNNYSLIDSDDASTLKYEPTYHVTGFSASANSAEQITLSWTDAIGTVLPDNYLIKASTVDYSDISAPVDGTEELNATLVKNITYGTQTAVFTGLNANTTYYFEIYPYTNKGADINYKTYAGTLPQASVTTDYSSSSDLVEQSGFTYAQDIDYSDDVAADVTSSSTTLWGLTIRDGGASADDDAASTTLQNLTLSVSNASLLNSIAIYDGSTEIQEVPASATVNFTGLGLEASDDGTKDFLIKATFNTTVTDNQIVSFSVSGADVTSASAASSFANFSTLSSSTSSPDNQIEVDATKLVISSYDSPVDVNTNFGFSVEARDANENVDLDESATVDLTISTGDGSLSSSTGTSQSLSSGTYSWSDLQYNIEQTFEITASATGLTSASQSINVNSSSNSEADAPATQVASTTISSLDDTEAEAITVFKFDITDNGSGNGLGTDVTNIRLKPGSSNSIGWIDHIQGVTIDDGSSVSPASVNITDSYIDINLTSGTIQVTDGTSTEITIGVFLNSSNITDNGVLQMMIDSDAHGFTADASGSGFASTFSGDVISNTHTVEVTATELKIIEQPTDVYTSHVMSPSVTVEAIDANGNRDLDYVTGMSLASSGPTLSGTNTETPVSGLGTFDDIQFSNAGTGATLDISSGGLTNAVSSTFDVTLSVPEIEITHSSTTLNAADGSTDIDFGSVAWGSTATADLTIDNLGQADLTITTPVSDAGDFTVSSQPASSVSESGSTSMQISFTPSSAGAISNTITVSNNDGDEGSFVLNLTGTGTLNANSDLVAAVFDPTDNIDYSSYQSTDISTDGAGTGNIKIGEFEIRDGGGSDDDNQSTILTDLTISVSNSANLNRLAIVDGGTVVDEAAAGSSVSFSGMTLTATDDGSKTFDVYASFQSTVTDNEQIQLTVTSVTAGSGSGFAAANGGGAATPISGDDNRIEVDATKLIVSSYDSPVDVNTNFGFSVEARDANENVDLDESTTVNLDLNSGAGALSSTPGTMSSGTYSWSDLQYNVEQTFEIRASASGLTSASQSINVNSSSNSEADAPATQVASTTISSLDDTDAEAITVFKFDITDNGSGNGLGTDVTNIRLKPGSSNNIDWTDHIQGVTVDDGAVVSSSDYSVTIFDAYIDINLTSGTIQVTDGTSTEITIGVFLNSSNVTDNGVLQMMIDSDAHGFTADATGSDFASTFSGDVISNTHTVEVTATELNIIEQPTDVYTNHVMSPSVTVEAIDANGNRDLDYVTDMSLASSGPTLSGTNTETPVSGLGTFDDIQFSNTGTGATLTISSGALTNAVSSTFDVTLSVPEIEITHSSTTMNAEDDATDIDFGSVAWGSTATADLTIDNLGQADLTISSYPDAGDFTVTSNPSSPVSEGGSTSMQISFTPSSAGAISNTITVSNNDGDEGSFVLNLTGTGTLNATSDVIATAFDPTDNIDYSSYQSTDISTDGAGTGNIKIGEFEIRDGGGSDDDNQSTILTDITFSVSNSANLNRLAIVNGGTVVDEAAAGSSVSFSGMTLTATDDGSKTFDVYASFQGTVTDNEQIQLTVTSVTAGSGSGFAAANGGGAATPISGDDNRIEVSATTYNLVSYPSNVDVNSDFTIQVEAVDNNNNRDLDEVTSTSVMRGANGTGSLSNNSSKAMTAGFVEWTNLQYDTEDNFSLQFKGLVSMSPGVIITTNRAEQTFAQDPASQIAGTTISTVNNDEAAERIDVFKFTVEDEGSGSGDATTLTKIRIKPGASNQVDWLDAIQGGRLNNGFITLSGVTVTDTYIDFNISGGNNTISDGGQLDITLSIYLNQNDKMIDGQTLSFMVDADNHGWTDDGSGSALKTDFGSDVVSNDFTIDVTATEMEFVTVPATVTVGDAFTVEVQPVDVHGNVDTDEATEATIALNTGTGSLYTADASVNFSSGAATWADLEYNVAETFNLQATHASFSTITSSDINASSATAPNAPAVSTAYLADDQIQIDISRPAGIYGTDWDGYVVFARENASNNADMTADDFSDFTASTTYGSGTADNNSYCVAKVSSDADLTATITVLTRNNNYYFEAFAVKEINGSGNDLWSSASAEVSANADVQGVSGLSATAGDAQASLNWTNYSGPQGIWWDEVVILAKKGSSVDATPTGDGSAYTANSVFTSGTGIGTGNYVVYKGTGTSTIVTGLNNGEDYYFRVFVRRGTEWTDADHYQSTSVTPSGGSGNVIITEVTDYSSDDTKSYIELYNAGSSAVNMNGWEVSQYNSDATITLGNSTQQNTSADLILNPGEYALIVRSNWSGLKSEYGIANDVAMFTGSSIPTINGNERYVLSDGLAKATQDEFGSTGTFAASDNSCYERNSIPSSDGTLESSWNESSNASYGYTPAGENNNPLPVELIVFNVERDGNQAVLYWVTASEKNNSHFEVQRSQDAEYFLQTEVISGAGNSQQENEYTSVDVPETSGLVYYRFKQVDYDGQFTYSPVRVVDMSTDDQPLSMRDPWITDDQLNTVVENTSEDQKLLLEIYNMSGQKISERQFNAEENASHIRMQMPYGERGVYFLRVITAENQVLTKKFLY